MNDFSPNLEIYAASVLVVDDDPDICEMLGEVLRSEGYSVDTAPTTQKGGQILAAGRHDVVLTDCRMLMAERPGDYGGALDMNAHVTEAAQALGHTAALIVMTANYEASTERPEELKDKQLLLKPFDIDKLIIEVGVAVAAARAARTSE